MARWRELSARGLLHHGATAAMLLVALAEAVTRHQGSTRLAAVAWAAAFAGPLIVRRRYPVPVFVIVVASAHPEPRSLPVELSGREVEVLGLMARGLTNAAIAGQLYVTEARSRRTCTTSSSSAACATARRP